VLADVKAEPSVAAARPALTSSARVGRDRTRSGREKACGAVEQKKRPQVWTIVLASSAAITERKKKSSATDGY